jgi:hypothetical protein
MSAAFNWREHLDVHPAAEQFLLMPEAELADDIKKNGLRTPYAPNVAERAA